jgi:hypothetical protein
VESRQIARELSPKSLQVLQGHLKRRQAFGIREDCVAVRGLCRKKKAER